MKKVEALFERARTDALTPNEMEKLWRSVAAGGPGGGGSSVEGPAGAPGGGLGAGKAGGLLKLGAALAVAGGLAAGLTRMRGSHPEAPVAASAPASEPSVPHRVEAPAPEAAPAAPTVAWEDLPRATERTTGEPAPLRRAHPRSEPAVVPTAVPAPATATEATEEEEAAPAAAPAPSEGALLLEARRHLTSDPAGTLSLTDEAARRFPAGPLAPEREVLAIEALARLGRAADARARLAVFRARYPHSPHLGRLESLIGP